MSHSLGARNSKVKAPADSVSDESLLPGSQGAVFLLCPHLAEGTGDLSSLFHKDTISTYDGSTLMN